jgi:hypothetical protein
LTGVSLGFADWIVTTGGKPISDLEAAGVVIGLVDRRINGSAIGKTRYVVLRRCGDGSYPCIYLSMATTT